MGKANEPRTPEREGMVVRLPKAREFSIQDWRDFLKTVQGRLIIYSLFFALYFFTYASPLLAWDYDVIDGVRVIENQVITEQVIIDGSSWNGAIIRNNIFRNQPGQALQIKNVSNVTALQIKNVSNVTVENNEFTGMQMQAILLGSNQTGTNNVIIKNNYFHDMPYHGIHAQEPNTNLQVLNNTFINVTIAADGDKRHAIYIKGPGFLIEGNRIEEVADGHGISVRTAGTVRGNWIEGAFEYGIAYFSDASTSGNGTLIIEGNVCVNNGLGGIKYDYAAGSTVKISKGITRFNTLVDNNLGIWLESGFGSTQFEVYGNIVVESSQNYADFDTEPRLCALSRPAISHQFRLSGAKLCPKRFWNASL